MIAALVVVIGLLCLTLGLLIGFYGRSVHDKLSGMHEAYKEAKEFQRAGVVRPTPQKVTPAQPINLESETGGVRRPTPDQHMLANIKERDKILKNRHS